MPITEEVVIEATANILEKAIKGLPSDVIAALESAQAQETSETGRSILSSILENARIAQESNTVVCQDTCIASYSVKVGTKAPIEGSLKNAIRLGTEKTTREVPLIPHCVHPITRKNTGTGTGPRVPLIHWDLVEDSDEVEITALPVGAGSENVSALKMFTASDSLETIKRFIVDTVAEASSKPCPPIIVGVGLGTQFEMVGKVAKEAALRPLDKRHPEPEIAALEAELLEMVNSLGIGPMGLGGRTTALAVNIEYGNTHTPNFPVGIKIQCWAARRATARIKPDGTVQYS